MFGVLNKQGKYDDKPAPIARWQNDSRKIIDK
jgi:hypothetical protein